MNKPDAIVVNEYQKFINSKRTDVLAENLFKNSYWNVFKYDEVLEKFLIENSIDYSCKNLNEFL
jgi:hypothetical protein